MIGRRTRAIITIATIAGVASTAVAAPVITPALDLNAAIGYATNPFLIDGSNTDSGYGEITIAPRLDISEALGTGRIGVYYRRQQYFRRYSENEDYGANASANMRLSQVLSIRGALSYDSSIIGGADTLSIPGTGIVPGGGLPGGGTGVDPGTPIGGGIGGGGIISNPIGGDVGLLGLRQRRNSLTGTVGATMTPSARDTWTLDLNAARIRYPNDRFGLDYKSYGGVAGYSRAIDETLSLGAQVAVTQVDYASDAFAPDTLILQPELTITKRFAGDWTLTGAAGVSITENDLPSGKESSTALSGSLRACHTGPRADFCAAIARAAAATGFGGVQQTTSGSLSYAYRLDEQTTVRADGSYSRVANAVVFSEDDTVLTGDGQDFVSVGLNVDRRISPRLSLTGGVSYRDSFTDGFNPAADFGARVGVQYALGGRR